MFLIILTCMELTAMSESLFERYRRLKNELEGKWFALSADDEILAKTIHGTPCILSMSLLRQINWNFNKEKQELTLY